jgi:NDP-sugar pyrophosphorylase family protein
VAAPVKRPVGVILAAGRGTRLGALGERWPKPLLPIGNRPLIERQIEDLRGLGVERVVVVVGHLRERLREALGDGARLGVRIELVEQREPLGIAHAALAAVALVDGPFYLWLGDIFYVPRDLGALARAFEGAEGVLAVRRDPTGEVVRRNAAVVVDGEGFVRRVVEKPRHVTSALAACGLYLWSGAFFDALRATPRTALRDEYEIATAVQLFVSGGGRVRAAEVVEWESNVTTPADLLECQRRLLRSMGVDRLVAAGARVHPGAELSGAVVGERAVIERPIRVEDALVLPDTVVAGEGDLVRCIVGPGVRVEVAG